MNISCPDCYAVYEVDLPDIEEHGEIDVKCVKCQCVFAVHGEPAFSNVEEAEASEEVQSIAPPIHHEELGYNEPPNSPQDDELDDFLDNLIEREISDAANEPFSDTDQGDLWAKDADDNSDEQSDLEDKTDIDTGEFSTTSEIDDISENSLEDDDENSWAKAFEDDPNQVTNEDEESIPPADELKSDEYASDDVEDLWSKAFSKEELGQNEPENENVSLDENQDAYTGIDLDPKEDREEELESDIYGLKYADEDESFDEFELKPNKKKKLGLSKEKTGSLVVTGILVGLLLISGSVYFAFQTFAPDGLADIKKPVSAIPEGLTPKDNSSENIFSTDDGPAKLTPSREVADNKPVQEVKTGLAGDLAKSKILDKSEGVSQIEESNRVVKNTFKAFNPAETQVTMSAILPVAYDANDIKILSFTLELDLSNQSTAQQMRETLPVYENIMVAGVEGLTSNQFFNDIIYVKEKLRKKFMSDFNASLQGGRVSKVRFREFLIQ